MSSKKTDAKINKKIEKLFSKPDINMARKRSKGESAKVDFNLGEDFLTLGLGKKYHIKTYGCQMNDHDSEAMCGILENMGFESTTEVQDADLILLNTCAVRGGAENKVFGALGSLKHLKRENPDLILGICGCMPQEEVVVNEILTKYQHVDLVFGTHNIHKLPEYVKHCIFDQVKVVEVWSNEGGLVENLPHRRGSGIKASVNIMYGCDEFCTYCIVPYTRGKERSRKPKDIIDEIKSLIADGYKEVNLLGQNVNAYGKDFVDLDYSFAMLLSDIQKLEIPRVRFTTSHPRDLDDETIDVIASGKNIMPHLHLPVQSGSDEILKKMNRKYTREHYMNLINKLKEKLPTITFTTDIIVGFPNETNEQFEDTVSLVKEVGYSGAFTFIYSKREGTSAAKLDDSVEMADKKQRLNTLNDVLNNIILEDNKKIIGSTVEVLVEGTSKNNKSRLTGYTPHFKLVNFEGNENLIGQIVKVKIVDVKTFYLSGEIL